MRFLLNLLDLLISLPWWGSLAVIAGLIALFFWARWYLTHKFEQIVHEAVVEAGSALKDAQVIVNSVTAAPVPTQPSPYDLPADDENFMEGVDGEVWDEEGINFYWIDVTITPAGNEPWDPTGLAMVPADYTPDDVVEISEQLCGLHSAERFVSGRWEPMPEKEIRGPQRLKMLFGVHDGLRAVKFANMVTYFGHIDLPKPLPRRAAARQ